MMPTEGWVERYHCDFAENLPRRCDPPGNNGRIAVPQGPGLGVDPHPRLLDTLRTG
jgi:hypothetical protein